MIFFFNTYISVINLYNFTAVHDYSHGLIDNMAHWFESVMQAAC